MSFILDKAYNQILKIDKSLPKKEKVQMAKKIVNSNIDDWMLMINPKITEKSRRQKIKPESCLSIKDNYKVIRSTDIAVEFYDENNNKHKEKYNWSAARLIQHEIDHLKGILISNKGKKLY